MTGHAAATTASATGLLRVVLGIPHARLLHALAAWLEQSGRIRVVGRAPGYAAAVSAALETGADVVVLGQTLAGEAAGERLHGLIAALAGIPVVVVGLDGSGSYAAAFRAAGAADYLVLDMEMGAFVEELWHAARRGPHS